MISKPDWDVAGRDWIAAGRERVPPPTPEKIEALFLGSLPQAEADRLREQLAYYPEMVRVMTDPVPLDVGADLPEEEVAADLERIRRQINAPFAAAVRTPSRRRSPSWSFVATAAAIALLALGGIAVLLHSRSESIPRSTKILYADGDRGGTTRGAAGQPPIELTAGTEYLLKLVFWPERPYRQYRLELVDAGMTPPRSIWNRNGVQRERDGSYPVELAGDELKPGRYRLILYGVQERPELLATYSIRVYAK
jgi:hypothetical protein